MSEIWAKSGGVRLKKHIEDILECFNHIKSKIPLELHTAIKIAIFYHDLGKSIPSFQIKILGNKEYNPFDVSYEIPHSLFSIFWIDDEKLSGVLKNENLKRYVISAVAYHHWKDSFDRIITGSDESFLRFTTKIINEWKPHLERNLKDELKNFQDSELQNLVENVTINEKKLKGFRNGVSFFEYAIPPYKIDYEPMRGEIKKEWIIISGMLQRCDHFASWCEEENESTKKIEIEPLKLEIVKDKIREKINLSDNEIWQFQEFENATEKNVILIAPTGYGKTEFAFLWGSNEKLFYTLPLRAAVNQIFERSKKLFGEEKTGILHSDADIYLLGKEMDVGDSLKLYELAKNLSYPIIISTGDQFFPYALRPPGYERIFSAFSNSNLVIDEVQAYDPKACAIVVKFIKWIYSMGGKFLLMTATLPQFALDAVKENIDLNELVEINIYEKEKERFEKLIKHTLKIEVIDSQKQNLDLENILNAAEEGKRVLVILNTVKQAQNIYERLKESASDSLKDKIFLLHSRFTFEDRRNKEAEFIEKEFKNPKPSDEQEGKILVATQVVEASLDIDADVLFTEICPLDSLIQRMGRVLRRIGPTFRLEQESFSKKIYKDMYKNKSYEVDMSQPNIFIWVFENSLESGKVYENELLKLSLAWLWRKSKGEIKDINFSEDNKTEFFNKEFCELFKDEKEQKDKKKKDTKSENILDKIVKGNEWIIRTKGTEVAISEYDKYKLVTPYYKSLSKYGNYLKRFFETLEVLEAGWMSEKKSEAEAIFREICEIKGIPHKNIEIFFEQLKNFIYEYQNTKKSLYTIFKNDVLSKFTVSLPFISRNIPPIYLKINEKNALDDNWKKRLKRWLAGIYCVDIDYNSEIGVIQKSYSYCGTTENIL